MGNSRSKKILISALAVVAVTGLIAAGGSGTASAKQPRTPGWYTAWAQSQQDLAPTALSDQSARMIAHLSQGGNAVRIRIQNQFGTAPLTVDAAAVAISQGQGPAVVNGTTHSVTFNGGRRSVTIPVGGQAWSDAAELVARPQDDVAVSLYVRGAATPGQHDTAFRDNYLTAAGAGDHVRDQSGAAYTNEITSTYLVSAVDVHNPRLKGTIVAYGSSIVDGTGSTNCGPGCTVTGNNQRWADDLAGRIVDELPGNQQLAVANEGIGGTTSVTDCPGLPSSYQALAAGPRLSRDVLALHGVTGVIFYYGTNDLQDGCTSAQILASYASVFKRLHDAGIRVYVVPTTPRPIYTDQMNLYRWDVDTYSMNQGDCGGACDGVIDFGQVIEDPLNPNAINPSYDNGDGIHVNIAGQKAEADTISLPLLASSTR